MAVTTVFVDTRLSKNKTIAKRFQNFRQSYALSTDWIEIHQSEPLVWPSDLFYILLAGCDWWISIRYVDNVRLTEILETFLWVFCFPKSRVNDNGGNCKPCRIHRPSNFFPLSCKKPFKSCLYFICFCEISYLQSFSHYHLVAVCRRKMNRIKVKFTKALLSNKNWMYVYLSQLYHE